MLNIYDLNNGEQHGQRSFINTQRALSAEPQPTYSRITERTSELVASDGEITIAVISLRCVGDVMGLLTELLAT